MTDPDSAGSSNGIRIDKWLWYARFFKSRNLASKLAQAHRIRVNSVIVTKASANVKVGDVLTFPQARDIRVVRILSLGTRRGPAPEAQDLYEDLSPPQRQEADKTDTPVAKRAPGAGRPTKAERRALDKFRAKPEEEA
ncbi:MAG: RNA-binding S4 domain-containing protein [Alphaproteobacteria bacterium]|nr:MAG: RNA-binding S4 domain-containing protein [Alphaproteobacteria bacterium]